MDWTILVDRADIRIRVERTFGISMWSKCLRMRKQINLIIDARSSNWHPLVNMHGMLTTAGTASMYVWKIVSADIVMGNASASRLFEYPLHETSIIPLPLIRDIDRAEKDTATMYVQRTHKVYNWNSVQARDVNIKLIINMHSPNKDVTRFSVHFGCYVRLSIYSFVLIN